MAGYMITVAASLQCPHGGTVQIVSSNTHVQAAGAFVATAADTFTVSGCPFQLPTVPPTPSPCVTVQWLTTDLKTKVNGAPTLSQSSSGICLSPFQVPQGPPVIVSTQTKTQSM
jgi:hypothetical protein